jgi:general secretion pathway protein A
MVYLAPAVLARKSALLFAIASPDAADAMMQDFTSSDFGTLGRAWRERCQPQFGPALAMGVLIGFLVGGGLTVRQVPPDSLLLWSKYQIAQAAAGAGLSSVTITWPGERGETETTAGDLMRTPGLNAWAAPVSREIGAALLPAAVCSFLAFAVMLIWGGTKPEPAEAVADPRQASAPAVEHERPEPSGELPSPDEPSPLIEPAPISVPAASPMAACAASDPPAPPQEAPAVAVPASTISSPPADEPVVSYESHWELTADASLPLALPLPGITPPTAPPAPPIPNVAPTGKPHVSYEAHWGLTELPFENVPDPKYYFPAPMHEEALHRLLYGVQTRKGAVMLTGEIGCGKTLLSRELSRHLTSEQYDLALIANPSFAVDDFLSEIVYQLGMEPAKTKVEVLRLLNDRLLANYQQGRQTIIVVDEAQAIPDNQVFEELRLLLNFQLNDRFLLTLVLMGQPELNNRVMALKQFAQRISIKYHLGAFSAEETEQYVAFRLKAAHCEREVFSKDALAVIFQHSGGIPRSINRLCDLCLLISYMDRAAMVDQKIAERAAGDLA